MDGIRELTEIVERVAHARTFDEAAETLIDWAQEFTGCDAAMLRLVEPEGRAGEWIPAVVHQGLSARFLQDEALIGAEECMCGRVCSCLGDPGLPFFTIGGSFVWGRVQSIAEEFPPEALGNVRGRCILEGYDSIAIFPLVSQRGPMGSLHLADFAPEKFSGNVDILEAACRICGSLLVRYQDEERERAVLQAVEAALLPRELPQIPGLDLAVAFTSATEMARVGGDFYDAFALDSGEVLVFVGDYCGKGMESAGMAARVRHGITDLAHTYPDPGELLAQTNELLAGILPGERFVTLVVCRYSREGELVAAVAGHPRPLRLEQGGALEEIVLPPNLPLGLDPGVPFASETVRFSQGPILLLYTDGITDSRRDGKLFGVEGITAVWRDAQSCPVPDLPEILCRESERFHEERRSQDDRLVLVAQFTG
jgi:serine phosphatase RsbU (regulator of sigma subunit)